MKPAAAVAAALALLAATHPAAAQSESAPSAPSVLVRGLDHVNLAVADLDSAAHIFRRLGFALKPGRAHANGIRNWHVKFRDGTEIELISVERGTDALTREYRRLIEAGDGPAFAALYAPNTTALEARLTDCGLPATRAHGLVTFPEGHALRYLFIGGRNLSATDESQHFAHANTARSLVGVSVAKPSLDWERRLMTCLGLATADTATGVVIGEGMLHLERADSARHGDRPIRRIEVEVEDIQALLRVLTQSGVRFVKRTGPPGAVEVDPRDACGVTLRFHARAPSP